MDGGGGIVDERFCAFTAPWAGLQIRTCPSMVFKGDAMIAKVTSNRQIALGIIGNMVLRSEQGENKYRPQPS